MTAQLIDGNALARQIRAEVAGRTQALKARGVEPTLAIILVGDDPASQVYVKHKVNDSSETGLAAKLERYGADLAEAELLERIDALNKDPSVHGILVQLPLPKHLDEKTVIAAIDPDKDVDGITPVNAGRLVLGMEAPVSCTPLGCLMILQQRLGDLSGLDAVVVGRSIVHRAVDDGLVHPPRRGS